MDLSDVREPLTARIFIVPNPWENILSFAFSWTSTEKPQIVLQPTETNDKTEYDIVPYTLIVIPLLVLSAYLLLSKPRQKHSAPPQDVHP